MAGMGDMALFEVLCRDGKGSIPGSFCSGPGLMVVLYGTEEENGEFLRAFSEENW
jgi:hypothetical protein